MEEAKHKIKIKRHSRQNWYAAAACLLSIVLLVCLSAQYLSFVSKTIYAESTEHLEEVLHKSNNMLSMIVKKNISYLHLWNGFLDSNPDDDGVQMPARRRIWSQRSSSLALPNSTFFLTTATT